jgi:2-polyprenyl-3-methyl-5-hydroxy-6-metoxy-1,4-benzoquinol methylase
VTSRDNSIDVQERFWNGWNVVRETRLVDVSEEQSKVILGWMSALRRTDLSILEVGCGAGWMSERLQQFGSVTATDLAREVIARARTRLPKVRFLAGDFMALSFPRESYDVVVSLEVLPHVGDQAAFIGKIAVLLRPGGILMLGTQNGWVLERCSWVKPQAVGQIRRWTNRRELGRLLRPHFAVGEMFTITPDGDRGLLRLANSVKLNGLLARMMSAERVRRLKERTGCGRTIMAYATKRAH